MRYYHVLLLTTLFDPTLYAHGTAQLLVHSDWQILEPCIGTQEWVMVGYITFKNKSRAPALLEELILTWHGTPLTDLTGSLFRKKHHHQFMAIEEFCLADSSWDAKTQQLTLKMCSPLKLSSETTVYLTLLVPPSLKLLLTTGYLTLDVHPLPDPFKPLVQDQKMRIRPGRKK